MNIKTKNMIKNICGIIFSIGVIGFTIYYINNNVKEGWVGNTNDEYILLKLDTIGGDYLIWSNSPDNPQMN